MILLSSTRFLRSILPAAALTAALLAPGVSHATLVTFDDLTCGEGAQVPTSYSGLTWDNFYCMDSSARVDGYHNGAVSPSNVAFNWFSNPANFSISSPSSFTLNSAYLTAAWNNGLNVQVQAYRSGSLVSTTNHVLQTTGPLLVNFNLVNVDQVVFTSSGGINAGFGGSGEHFVMDNLVVNETIGTATPVPTLSQWSLLLLSGLMGALALRTRRRNVA